MKTLYILFAVAMFNQIANNVSSDTMRATFDGLEDDTYYFSDSNEDTYQFENIDSKVLETYKLSDNKYIGKEFIITYSIEKKMDDTDEEYEVWKITKLELVE